MQSFSSSAREQTFPAAKQSQQGKTPSPLPRVTAHRSTVRIESWKKRYYGDHQSILIVCGLHRSTTQRVRASYSLGLESERSNNKTGFLDHRRSLLLLALPVGLHARPLKTTNRRCAVQKLTKCSEMATWRLQQIEVLNKTQTVASHKAKLYLCLAPCCTPWLHIHVTT